MCLPVDVLTSPGCCVVQSMKFHPSRRHRCEVLSYMQCAGAGIKPVSFVGIKSLNIIILVFIIYLYNGVKICKSKSSTSKGNMEGCQWFDGG